MVDDFAKINPTDPLILSYLNKQHEENEIDPFPRNFVY
jgi:hypothetical protein